MKKNVFFDNIVKIKLIFFFKSLFFFSPILTLFFFSRNLNTFQVVSLEAILILSVLIFEIPTGIIADRIGRKYSLIMLILAYIIGNVWTIYAYTYFEFMIIFILFGAGIAFGSGAIEALVYDTLKKSKQENQMTKVWGSINSYALIASVFAVVMGGYLVRQHDPKTFVFLLWLYVFGALVALFISFFIKRENFKKKEVEKNVVLFFKKSTVDVLKNKNLRRIIYLLIFTSPFTHIIMFLFQPYFKMASVPGSIWGVCMAGGMLIGVLFYKYAYRIEAKLGMKKTIFFATILPGLIYLGMALFIGPIISFVWYILLSSISHVRDPLFAQYQNDHIKSYNRATILSIISMIVSLYLVIMRFSIGAVANYNLLLSFAIMGGMIIIGAILFRIDERNISVNLKNVYFS